MTQTVTAINMPVISVGSQGEAVRFVQKILIRYGYYNGAFDAKYGSLTKKAVEAFQQDYNQSLNPTTKLVIDGSAVSYTHLTLPTILLV